MQSRLGKKKISNIGTMSIDEADEYAKIKQETKKNCLEDNIQIKPMSGVIFCNKPDKTIKTNSKFLLKKSQKAK